MVRNNRRKAFTIVELVIVIAVIAILAAVMIPTFGGIIKRANISADTQLAASINTQLSIYKAEGNKIETEADLINALRSDTDFTAHLNPKSAKHGYHFWYNAEKQTVELLSNDEVLTDSADLRERVQAQVFAAGGDGVAVAAFNPLNFASSAPRRVVPGYYFLDQVVDGKGNDISNIFGKIEGMSTSEAANTDYADVIEALNDLSAASRNENQQLAVEVLKRITATAIMTNQGTFINATGTQKVNYIYIPAPPALAEEEEVTYYLNHSVVRANGETVKSLDGIAEIQGNIEIPANVKVAEGSFAAFGEITVNVAVDDVTKLDDVLYAGAVHVDATVVLSNGASYKVDGSIVKDLADNKQDVLLPSRNKVTGFVTGTSSDSKVVDTHIALDKIIKDVSEHNSSLTLTAGNFTAENPDLPIYEGVIWSVKEAYKGETKILAENAEVEVTRDGVVTFGENFNGEDADKIVFTATAIAGGEAIVDYTLNVVTLDKITTKFNNTDVTFAKENGVWELKSAKPIVLGVATGLQGEVTTQATFSGEYIYYYNGKAFIPADLGLTPDITIETQGDYFSINNLAWAFDLPKVQELGGGVGEQTVTIEVEEFNAIYSDGISVKIKDNTAIPYAIATPSYTAREEFEIDGDMDSIFYRYRVGKATPLPLNEIFALKPNMTAADYTVFVFSKEPIEGGTYFNSADLVGSFKLSDGTNFLDFKDSKYIASNDQTYYLALGVEELDANNHQWVYAPDAAVVEITLVDKGVNITTEENITTGDKFKTPVDGQSIVLHNDLSGFGPAEGAYVKLSGGSIYGNYFKVDASTFYDTNSTDGGYSFISMTNGGSINQFILDGPVFPVQCMQAKDHKNYFCFGITLAGNKITINDSYLSHFASPVYVSCVTFEANNTVFEGGSLSNVYIRQNVENVNFTDVMTIQNREGYTSDFDSETKVLGMGIFIHPDQKVDLHFDFDNVEQYNWLNKNNNQGTYTSIAINMVYSGLFGDYSSYMHDVGHTYWDNGILGFGGSYKPLKYVNAAIAAMNKSAKIFISSDKHEYRDGSGSASEGGLSGTVWVSTYACKNDGTCCSDAKVTFKYGGAETFRAVAGTNFK